MASVLVGASLGLVASATVWIAPGETCERETSAAPRVATTRMVRFRLEALESAARSRMPTEVVGRVVDASGHAVAGVLVVPRPISGGPGDPLGGGVLTDRSGRFRFKGLSPGQYWFIAIHGSYPFGSTPAMPVADHLEVAITLDTSSVKT